MKKRIIAFGLLLCILATVFSGCTSKPTPTDISEFEYTVYEEEKYVVIDKFIGNSKDIVVPEKIEGYDVKLIFWCAFMNSEIESVILPDTLELIHANTFTNCQNLHTVKLGKNVKKIVYEAFRNCKKLEKINFPEGLTEIENKAFENCESLKSIKIPKTVTHIGMQAFYGSGLNEVIFEEGISTVGSHAAFWCGEGLKTVTIPASVKKYNNPAFGEYLKEIHFLGDAPECNTKYLPPNATIYHKKKAKGWDDDKFKDFKLVAE